MFSHCHVQIFATPLTIACQASLSFTISLSLLKLMSIELVTPSNHFILCHPILLLPSIFPSIRVLFQWVSSSHQVAKVLQLPFQRQSFQWTFTVDFLEDWLVWSPCCPRDSQESFPADPSTVDPWTTRGWGTYSLLSWKSTHNSILGLLYPWFRICRFNHPQNTWYSSTHYTYWKKSTYKCTHSVQSHAVCQHVNCMFVYTHTV